MLFGHNYRKFYKKYCDKYQTTPDFVNFNFNPINLHTLKRNDMYKSRTKLDLSINSPS